MPLCFPPQARLPGGGGGPRSACDTPGPPTYCHRSPEARGARSLDLGNISGVLPVHNCPRRDLGSQSWVGFVGIIQASWRCSGCLSDAHPCHSNRICFHRALLLSCPVTPHSCGSQCGCYACYATQQHVSCTVFPALAVFKGAIDYGCGFTSDNDWRCRIKKKSSKRFNPRMGICRRRWFCKPRRTKCLSICTHVRAQ